MDNLNFDMRMGVVGISLASAFFSFLFSLCQLQVIVAYSYT